MKTSKRVIISCNGCTSCCQGKGVPVSSAWGDDMNSYILQPYTNAGDFSLVATKSTGGCIYLGELGCTIHERAPSYCRSFDCREFYEHTGIKLKVIPIKDITNHDRSI